MMKNQTQCFGTCYCDNDNDNDNDNKFIQHNAAMIIL